LSIYADSSFFVSLYVTDTHSHQAQRQMEKHLRIWLTPLHRVEIAHAVAQLVFQHRISAAEADRAYDNFENDRRAGLWLDAPVPEAAFDLAVELARRHVARLGCRTLDTLHIASALELGASEFWTFDERQKRLAKTVGLSTA
jgi:predicted nucleic acid-binding protein